MVTTPMVPYYVDDNVQLFMGDCREIIPTLGPVDLIVADPPYGETSLAWDRWPDDWPTIVSGAAKSMWCFGSMRMFLDRRDEFAVWRLSHDVVWEKANATNLLDDRFRRVHEVVAHWYRGVWGEVYHEVPREPYYGARRESRAGAVVKGEHFGAGTKAAYVDNGDRLARSVLKSRSLQGRATHPTEKPVGILDPLIRYGCPPGGTVLDPFAGSGSTAEAARMTGRKTILIEADERYCELIARRMSQTILEVGA